MFSQKSKVPTKKGTQTREARAGGQIKGLAQTRAVTPQAGAGKQRTVGSVLARGTQPRGAQQIPGALGASQRRAAKKAMPTSGRTRNY